jgi:CheY-like chemotaxis protein/HPt (histidine-containing phosphotransfer) domain-containing protein
MGGDISVQSQPGKGSQFTLILPFDACPAPCEEPVSQPGIAATGQPLPASPEEALSQGRLVLVAEDNPTNRNILSRQLARHGLLAELTENGRQALAAWQKHRHPLILTDCHMPEMDGYALARAVREEECRLGLSRTPLLAVTASVMQEETDLCLTSGMDETIAKPIDPGHLAAALAKWLPARSPAPRNFEPTTSKEDDGSWFDPLALIPLVGDDPLAIAEILQDFLSSAEAIFQEISQALKSGEADAAGKAAHKLKSSARAVGANALADCSAELEKAGKAGDLTLATGIGGKLADINDRTSLAIGKHLDRKTNHEDR